jgi:hypothetical protein
MYTYVCVCVCVCVCVHMYIYIYTDTDTHTHTHTHSLSLSLLSEISDQPDVTPESSKIVKLALTWVATTQCDTIK